MGNEWKYIMGWLLVCAGLLQAEVPQPRNVADLKKLQAKILTTVEQARPATVALTSSETGAWGSGVVVSEGGRILTAAHVSQGAKEMVVIFPNGIERRAKVLGANRTKDTAMLQIIQKGKYPYVEMGSSDTLAVGDYLVAMGHAGGHDALRKPPVRFGRLVSRNIGGFFASDCTLIGGDSGGPIFDIEGKLVGINSSIGIDLSANNHAGISTLQADWQRMENGEVWGHLKNNPIADNDSPVLGVSILGGTRLGVMLGGVFPDSPAQKAGVQKGDIVTAVNKVPVRNGNALLIEINRHRPGQTVSLTLLREKEHIELEVTLTRRGNLLQQ